MNVYRDLLLLFGYCLLIFYLSHQPTLPVPMAFPHQDKLVHATAYALMGILAWRSFAYIDRPVLTLAIISFLFCSLYGISDEYHQSFIVGRDADIKDWFADSVGAAIAIYVMARRGVQS